MQPNAAAVVYGADYPMSSSVCTHVVGLGDSNDNGYATSVCCGWQYESQCVKRFGDPGAPHSTVSCPDGYFMSGCSGWGDPDAWNVKYVCACAMLPSIECSE